MSDPAGPLRLATRGSDLARRQAGAVASALEDHRVDVELVEVTTTGDELRDELIHDLGTVGAFVRALDLEVIDGYVDAAVHSMKDVPTDQPETLAVAGVPERAAAEDVLVTPSGDGLESLPAGATVGTASLRRGAQLQAYRDDLVVEPVRGNVDTRIEKLLAPHLQREHERRLEAAEDDKSDGDAEGAESVDRFERSIDAWFNDLAEIERRALERSVETEYDGLVLAAAGLDRSGLTHHLDPTTLDPTTFVPAPGQGALAVTARAGGDVASLLHDVLDHPPTRVTTTVERTILSELGGGCVAPVGIHARLRGSVVATTVRVQSRDGTEEVAGARELPVEDHAAAAASFAADLADRGAADLIETARRAEPDEPKRSQ
ncbi:MAG: hydroxymethylbilane synthase [Salinirussus sp.]